MTELPQTARQDRLENLAFPRINRRFHRPLQRGPLPPEFIAPCLTTRADRVPVGAQWVHKDAQIGTILSTF